jgi:hypothetical protein
MRDVQHPPSSYSKTVDKKLPWVDVSYSFDICAVSMLKHFGLYTIELCEVSDLISMNHSVLNLRPPLHQTISRHTFRVLEDMLLQPDGCLVYRNHPPSDEVHRLSIDPTHTDAQELFAEAGVPISRARFPSVTFFWHNLLLDMAQLKTAFEHLEPELDPSNVAPQAADWCPIGWTT